MNIEQKLNLFAEKSARYILDKSIVEVDSGYLVFGCYHLQPSDNRFDVYYYEDFVETFSNKRTAISWCIAERYKQYKLSFEIKNLDSKKAQLSADIMARQRLREISKNSATAEIIDTKLEPKIRYYNSVKTELEKCLNLAKYLQLRGFSNETARSSRD